MIKWEGAELHYYVNGDSYEIELSDMQFAIITKILGLELQPNGDVNCFSDDTLKQLASMKGNPLKLKQQ